MSLNTRCLLLALFVFVTLSKHGLALPGDLDEPSTGSEASSPSITPLVTEDLDEEAERPSDEPMTFVYFDEIITKVCSTVTEPVCKKVETQVCRIVVKPRCRRRETRKCKEREIQECRTQEVDVCNTRTVPRCFSRTAKRAFNCHAERKRSAMRLGGRLGPPITTDSFYECCKRCGEVPNTSCRSWWRERGSNQLCYVNANR